MSRAYKKAFADFDYERVPAQNRKGYRVRRVYKGTYTRWDLAKPAYNRRRLIALAAIAASVVCFFAAVTRPSMVNIIPLSGVPGAICMIPLIFALLGAHQLFTSGNTMATRMFVSRRRYLVFGSFFASALGLIAAILSAVVCIRLGYVAVAEDWFTAALYLLVSLTALPAALVFFKTPTVTEKTPGATVSADARQ